MSSDDWFTCIWAAAIFVLWTIALLLFHVQWEQDHK